MKINGSFATIIGVAPREFIGSGAPPFVPDVWAPISMQPAIASGGAWIQQPDNAQVQLLARLQSGIARSQAESELLLIDQDIGETPGISRIRSLPSLFGRPHFLGTQMRCGSEE